MSTEKKEDRLYDFSLKSLSRGLILLFLPIVAYIIGLFPFLIVFFKLYTIIFISFKGILFYFILSVFLVFSFFMFIILESYIPCIFVKYFRIQVKPGEYQLSVKDDGFFYHMLFYTLYRPSLKLISFLPLVPLRSRLIKLAGLNIDKTSLLAGTEFFDEPYAVTIGKNTLIGGYAMIFAHLSDTTMRLKPVYIGNNCFIGNKSVIMPGVLIEDNVVVEPGAVVKEDQILKKNKRYRGNPAQIVTD